MIEQFWLWSLRRLAFCKRGPLRHILLPSFGISGIKLCSCFFFFFFLFSSSISNLFKKSRSQKKKEKINFNKKKLHWHSQENVSTTFMWVIFIREEVRYVQKHEPVKASILFPYKLANNWIFIKFSVKKGKKARKYWISFTRDLSSNILKTLPSLFFLFFPLLVLMHLCYRKKAELSRVFPERIRICRNA